MWKSEQPPDAILFPTWSLDRRLQLFGHIAHSSPQEDHHRAVAAVIRGCLSIGSDSQEDLATPGFVQWRQTLANRTLALHLPGGRQLAIRGDWRRIVDTATLQQSTLSKKKKKKRNRKSLGTVHYSTKGSASRTTVPVM